MLTRRALSSCQSSSQPLPQQGAQQPCTTCEQLCTQRGAMSSPAAASTAVRPASGQSPTLHSSRAPKHVLTAAGGDLRLRPCLFPAFSVRPASAAGVRPPGAHSTPARNARLPKPVKTRRALPREVGRPAPACRAPAGHHAQAAWQHGCPGSSCPRPGAPQNTVAASGGPARLRPQAASGWGMRCAARSAYA